MIRRLLASLLLLNVIYTFTQSPYTGINQFSSFYTNPNLINNFLSQLNTTLSPACNSIEGIGLPILAIKQILQSINSSLAYNNSNTYAKIIFFRERKNSVTFHTTYKLVVQIKSFASNNYLAIEGLYRQVGFPAFEVTTYYLDSNLDNIKALLSEYAIDTNSFFGCGDVKSIYSQANLSKTASPNVPAPYDTRSQLVNSTPSAAGSRDVDPNLIAQIIKLLQSRN